MLKPLYWKVITQCWSWAWEFRETSSCAQIMRVQENAVSPGVFLWAYSSRFTLTQSLAGLINPEVHHENIPKHRQWGCWVPSCRTSLSLHQNKAIWRHIPTPSPKSTTPASPPRPVLSTLLPLLWCREKPTRKGELQWLPAGSCLRPGRLDPGTHLNMPVQIQPEFPPVWPHYLSQHQFLTLSASLVSINYIVSVALHALDSPDLAERTHVQSQFLTAVSPQQHPAQHSHSQELSVTRSGQKLVGSEWPRVQKNHVSRPCYVHLPGCWKQGKGHRFLWQSETTRFTS